MSRQALHFAIALCLLPTLALSQEKFDRWRPVTESDWNVQENEALGIHHAILIYDGVLIDDRWQEKEKSYRSWYQRIRVFDEDGVEAFRTIEIPYVKGMKIKELKARTLKPDGEEIVVGKGEVYEKTVFSFGSYRMKAKAFAFKGVEAGDILEYYAYAEVKSDDPPKVQIRHHWYTLESELTWYYMPVETLSFDEHGTIRDYKRVPAYALTNAKQYYGAVEERPKEKPNRFYVRHLNLPGLPDEKYMPPDEEVATVFIGSYRFPEWEQKKPYWTRVASYFGKETLKFIKKDSRLDQWVDERAEMERNLNRDMEDCCAWIRENVQIFEWMNDKERPEKFESHDDVNDLLKKPIGSIYEVDMLCLAMLRRLGYDATIFHNRDQSLGPFWVDWHTPSQFTMSGVVVKEGDEPRWFFPGYPYSTPEAVLWRAAGCRALLEEIPQETLPILARIPMVDAGKNKISIKARLGTEDLVKLKGRLEVIWDCPSDIDLHLGIEDETKESACDYLRGRALQSGLSWEAFDESFTDDGRTIAYGCSIEVEGLIEDAGSRKIINLDQLRTDAYSLPVGPRECLILFRYPISYYSRIEFDLPEGFIFAALPQYVEHENSSILYKSQWTTEEERAIRQRKLNIMHSGYLARAAEALGRSFESIYAADMDPLVIKEDQGDE